MGPEPSPLPAPPPWAPERSAPCSPAWLSSEFHLVGVPVSSGGQMSSGTWRPRVKPGSSSEHPPPGPGDAARGLVSVELTTSSWRERVITKPARPGGEGGWGSSSCGGCFPPFLSTVLPQPFSAPRGGNPKAGCACPSVLSTGHPSRLRARLVRGQDRECWEAGLWGC